jgi:hypothetical protein
MYFSKAEDFVERHIFEWFDVQGKALLLYIFCFIYLSALPIVLGSVASLGH